MDNAINTIETGADNAKNHSEKVVFSVLAEKLMAHLPIRTREIIQKRYGLRRERGETLEKIGLEYKITRERVRQIISDAMKSILADNNTANFSQAEEAIIFTIQKNNGIIKETEAVNQLNDDGLAAETNAIRFLASCSKKIIKVEEKEKIEKCWLLDESIIEKVKQTAELTEKSLSQKKKTLNDDEIIKIVSPSFPTLTKGQILSYLSVSTKIRKNKFGKWGINSWAEISPKGTREKIYLVLKEKNKPLHFTEIATAIDQFQLGKKKAHPQTVHNELIKDDRFVLIGRGIYALAEWGYSEGTIKDVLKNILEKSERPLAKEEILEEVFKIRKVKKATVMINLNNTRMFERHNNSYSIKR